MLPGLVSQRAHTHSHTESPQAVRKSVWKKEEGAKEWRGERDRDREDVRLGWYRLVRCDVLLDVVLHAVVYVICKLVRREQLQAVGRGGVDPGARARPSEHTHTRTHARSQRVRGEQRANMGVRVAPSAYRQWAWLVLFHRMAPLPVIADFHAQALLAAGARPFHAVCTGPLHVNIQPVQQRRSPRIERRTTTRSLHLHLRLRLHSRAAPGLRRRSGVVRWWTWCRCVGGA